MTNILHNRKADNLKARKKEVTAWLHSQGPILGLSDIINRAFEAGVAAHSDHAEASRQMAMAKARQQFEAQHNTEPVAFMDVEPGSMLTLLRKEWE